MPPSPSKAFEDGIDLQIGLLEAFIPTSRKDWSGYPFPQLAPTAQQEMRTFRTIVLENPYLRATILPGMGGRIVSLFDKRTNTEILRRHPSIDPQPGGPRGAYVREGAQLQLTGQERLNAMGNIASQIEFTAEEEDPAAVWIAETTTGTGLSFHLRISLPADKAELQLEARILNRWYRPQPYNGALRIYLGEGHLQDRTFYSQERKAGLTLTSPDALFEGATLQNGFLTLSRFQNQKELAPRQVDTWTLVLTPISGLETVFKASQSAAVELAPNLLRLQVTEQRLAHKLLMLTQDGQTLEATLDLYPENLLEIPLGDLNPVELILRDPAKQEILNTTQEEQTQEQERQPENQPTNLTLASTTTQLQRAAFNPATRHLAYTLLATKALKEKRFAEAGLDFERALGFNAEDPLLWWAKALAARLDEQDNQAELLNAHYLAPLEPALRAESFLSQPVNLNPDPSPLLAPLEENAEEFIEVACLLIEAGLFDQASRWIDEAFRHRDLPMLRYLMAYCLLTATRLQTEASDQVRIAAKSPVAPPFPYRDIEIQAIQTLQKAFPEDKNLTILSECL